MDKEKEQLLEKFPFLCILEKGTLEYVGICINHDSTVVTFYDLGAIPDLEAKKAILELGAQWWEESNRKIPINIFMKKEMFDYKPYVKCIISKDVKVVAGYTVDLKKISTKRIKRKNIQLIRKLG
jgi:hypothetical protein